MKRILKMKKKQQRKPLKRCAQLQFHLRSEKNSIENKDLFFLSLPVIVPYLDVDALHANFTKSEHRI